MPKKPSLHSLNTKLDRATKTLDSCAVMIRDSEEIDSANIWHIGEALSAVFEIQLQIYRRRPDLTHWALKPELEDLAGRAVVKKISAELPATGSFGRLRLSGSAREDLTKFLLADEIEMPGPHAYQARQRLVFLLFTHSTIPEHL